MSTHNNSELRDNIHDILEVQHIAQGRGQKREEYEPTIIEEFVTLVNDSYLPKADLLEYLNGLRKDSSYMLNWHDGQLKQAYNQAITEIKQWLEK